MMRLGGWPTSRFGILTLKRRTHFHLGVPHLSRFSKGGTSLEEQILPHALCSSKCGWTPHLEHREMWATRPG